MTSKTTTGGCQCGAVRYRVKSELIGPHICYCRMCQKAAGNYFMPLAHVPRKDVEITRGEPSWFYSSEPVRRGFCSQCGTPLLFDDTDDDNIHVVLGSLDDPSAVEPTRQYGLEGRADWFKTSTVRSCPFGLTIALHSRR